MFVDTMPAPASRLALSALLDQQGRMLKVETALPLLTLIPERMVFREAIDAPFDLTLDCLSASAHIELERLIGEQISVRLLLADGSYRPLHAYVFGAAHLGSDGGLARYRLSTKPWLSFLAHRIDSFVYQDLTAVEVVEAVFKDYPQANHSIRATRSLRRRSLCTQYRESDLAFVERLLAEEGLSYRFEHLDDETAGTADSRGHARHVMVISDMSAAPPDLGETRFTGQHVSANPSGPGGAQQDSVTGFMVARRVAANAVACGSWNYKHLSGTAASDASSLQLGDLPALEVYDGSGAYRYQDGAHAERTAALALAALELGYKQFEGQGSARYFAAGQTFSLVDHPLFGANTTAFNYAGAAGASRARPDNRFALTAIEHHATNNLGAHAAWRPGSTELEPGTYLNHFHCVAAAAPLVPAYRPKPTAPSTQTALVVGFDSEPLMTDRDHRVKLQFAWQRGERPNAGGLAHPGSRDKVGRAPGNECSGSWVRVAQPAAGANWGSVHTPRIGTEVSIGFVEGDIDRPMVLGRLYNGADTPPFSAGADSDANHAGVISGVHAPSLDQSSFNQWLLDDARGQLRTRLLTGYLDAELGLGHLIQQHPASARRGSWRGSGFEALTQGWVSVRAAKGLLLSSTARAGTYGSAVGTQMDSAEALANLQAARRLGVRLGAVAKTAGGQPLAPFEDGQSVPKCLAQLDPRQLGKHPEAVNGQAAFKADATGRGESAETAETFASPLVLLDSTSAALLATEAGIGAFAGQDLALAAQGQVQQTAAHTWTSVTGKTTSWYVHAGGIQALAAHGPVTLRAHADALQLWADREVVIGSNSEQLTIAASTRIEMIAGQSSLTLYAGDIEFKMPGTFLVKGATHDFLGGSFVPAEIAALPVGAFAGQPEKH